MALQGYYFSFDGIPCTEYGLMVYDFASHKQGDITFPSAGEMIADQVNRRYDSFFYGIKQNNPLEFSFVFGADQESIDQRKTLDRWDIESIASWLTGHRELKWLEIEQPDLEMVRYKCIISDLKLISPDWEPWAFSCKVTCDSPFGYLCPETYFYSCTNEIQANLFNKSTYNGFYYPALKITMSGGNSISIINPMDHNREFAFHNLPNRNMTLWINNQNQVITGSTDINMYPYFNMNFFRLVRGDNALTIKGQCNIECTCEFPVNVGG